LSDKAKSYLWKLVNNNVYRVYLGTHMQTEEKVAVKVLQLNSDSDISTQDQELAEREVQLQNSLKHPNIAEIIEYGLVYF